MINKLNTFLGHFPFLWRAPRLYCIIAQIDYNSGRFYFFSSLTVHGTPIISSNFPSPNGFPNVTGPTAPIFYMGCECECVLKVNELFVTAVHLMTANCAAQLSILCCVLCVAAICFQLPQCGWIFSGLWVLGSGFSGWGNGLKPFPHTV